MGTLGSLEWEPIMGLEHSLSVCLCGLPSWKSAQFTHCWMHSGPSQFGRCLAIMFAICHWVLERLINSHANWKHKFDSEMTFVLGNLSQVLQITSLEAKHNLDLVKCQIRNQSINTQIKPTAQIVIERYWHIMGILPSMARTAPPRPSHRSLRVGLQKIGQVQAQAGQVEQSRPCWGQVDSALITFLACDAVRHAANTNHR